MSSESGNGGDVTGALYVTLLVMKAHAALKQHINSLDRPVVQSLLDISRMVVTILEDRIAAYGEIDRMTHTQPRSLIDRSRWN